MSQCVAVCCSVLQRVAVCCSVLQYVAVSVRGLHRRNKRTRSRGLSDSPGTKNLKCNDTK